MVDVQYEYFYDEQMRRFLDEVVRAFSGFQYETGWNGAIPPQKIIVPCRMATTNRQVANIMRNNSENTLISTPLITVWQTGLILRSDAIQNPSHVDTRQVWEREVDANGKYTGNPGNRYTVKRLMPRPFTMEVQVDIWTSNLNQKHQLAEQIFPVFYPFFSIQNSDNPLDWSALTTATIGDPTWSSKSIPIGTDDEIDVMTIPIKIPMWLTPPAMVTCQKVIHEVITTVDIANTSDNIQDAVMAMENDDFIPVVRGITTPGEYRILVENGIITLLGDDANPPSWLALMTKLGKYSPANTELHLKLTNDLDDNSSDIVGTIQVNATSPNTLTWQIDPDTLPANTLPPLNAIINPLTISPGIGLPAATAGQYYLLVSDIRNTGAWGSLVAKTNDIISYVNGAWVVTFTSTGASQQFVLNLHTGSQLRWDGTEWLMAIDGEYSPGYWGIVF